MARRNLDDERYNELSNRLELLVRATENLLEEHHQEQTNQAARHQDPDITRRIGQFKPPTFDGSTDPKKLENWVREFEKIFDVVGCPNVLKVPQAAFYLVDQADLWWAQNRAILTNQVGFSCDAFTQALRDKFYPIHLKKKLAQDFANLQMGGMTVEEYYQKFIELMRFSPHLILTEEMKATKFELGLTLELQEKLGGFHFTSLETVYGQAARLYEIGQTRRAKEAALRKRMNPAPSQHSFAKRPAQGQSSSFGNRPSNFQRQAPPPTNQRPSVCPKCQKNHSGTNCYGGSYRCFVCDKPGHRSYDCPNRKPGGNSAAGNYANQPQSNSQRTQPTAEKGAHKPAFVGRRPAGGRVFALDAEDIPVEEATRRNLRKPSRRETARLSMVPSQSTPSLSMCYLILVLRILSYLYLL